MRRNLGNACIGTHVIELAGDLLPSRLCDAWQRAHLISNLCSKFPVSVCAMPAQLASDGRSPDDSPIAAFIDTLSGWGKSALMVFPEGSWHCPSPPPFMPSAARIN